MMTANVAELNAALDAYNTAARKLGLVVIAGEIDKTVATGTAEHADEAILSVFLASERLMKLGSALATKAQCLMAERDLDELPESAAYAESTMPRLLKLADKIDQL